MNNLTGNPSAFTFYPALMEIDLNNNMISGTLPADLLGAPVLPIFNYRDAIKTVNVGFAAYFEELGRVGLMEANKDKTSVFISGTKVREQLVSGENPVPRIMRETTAAILVDFYKTKGE